MRKAAFSGMAAVVVMIGVAGAIVLFKTSPASSEDLWFGYAVCDLKP